MKQKIDSEDDPDNDFDVSKDDNSDVTDDDSHAVSDDEGDDQLIAMKMIKNGERRREKN